MELDFIPTPEQQYLYDAIKWMIKEEWLIHPRYSPRDIFVKCMDNAKSVDKRKKMAEKLYSTVSDLKIKFTPEERALLKEMI